MWDYFSGFVNGNEVETRRESEGGYLRCSINQYQTGNENLDVTIVESSYFSHNVAGDKYQCGPRKDTGYFPAFITTLEMLVRIRS